MPSSNIYIYILILKLILILKILNNWNSHVAFEYYCGHWGALESKRLRITAQGYCHHNPVKLFASIIQWINDYDY